MSDHTPGRPARWSRLWWAGRLGQASLYSIGGFLAITPLTLAGIALGEHLPHVSRATRHLIAAPMIAFGAAGIVAMAAAFGLMSNWRHPGNRALGAFFVLTAGCMAGGVLHGQGVLTGWPYWTAGAVLAVGLFTCLRWITRDYDEDEMPATVQFAAIPAPPGAKCTAELEDH